MTSRVYRNVTRRCWSVSEAGQPVKHYDRVVLSHAVFHVGEAGRKRVIETGRKNVHAWVRGIVQLHDPPEPCVTLVSYNPKRDESFMAEGQQVLIARYVIFNQDGTVSACF